MVEVRKVRPEDWPEFRRLRLEALQDAPLAFVERYDESVVKPDQFWQDRAERGAAGDTRVMYVGVHEGRLVGKASAFVEDDITDYVSVHIVGVYVTPAWRGRDDLAGRLIAAVADWGRADAKADRIRLFVTDGNDRAAAFYRRIGFERSGATLPYPNDPTIAEHELVLPHSD